MVRQWSVSRTADARSSSSIASATARLASSYRVTLVESTRDRVPALGFSDDPGLNAVQGRGEEQAADSSRRRGACYRSREHDAGEGDRGIRIVKDRPLAVAAVVAHDLACDIKSRAFKVW